MNKEKILEIASNHSGNRLFSKDEPVYALMGNEAITAFANRIMQECGKGEAVAWMTDDGRTVNLNQKAIMHKSTAESFNIPLYLHPQNDECEAKQYIDFIEKQNKSSELYIMSQKSIIEQGKDAYKELDDECELRTTPRQRANRRALALIMAYAGMTHNAEITGG